MLTIYVHCKKKKKMNVILQNLMAAESPCNFVKIQIGVIFLLQALLAFKDFKNVAHLTI